MTTYTTENILSSEIPHYLRERIPTKIKFLDDMFGGGLVPSVTYMLSGDPGSGKTTLMLQMADALTKLGNIVLFNSVEQTKDQVVDLASRLDLKDGFIFETHMKIEELLMHTKFLMDENPGKRVVLVLDSISAMAGHSRAKADKIANMLIKFCQLAKIPGLFLVHTTKNGSFAGNNSMKHAFDAHFHLSVLEPNNDDGRRVFYSEKNRYAPRRTEEMFLTDRGHVTMDEYNPSMDPMPQLMGDDDFELVG